MSKFTFVVCDHEYNEYTINSTIADKMYQPWVDAHPEFGPTGDKIPFEGDGIAYLPWMVSDEEFERAKVEDEVDAYCALLWLLCDIARATIDPDFAFTTYCGISVDSRFFN